MSRQKRFYRKETFDKDLAVSLGLKERRQMIKTSFQMYHRLLFLLFLTNLLMFSCRFQSLNKIKYKSILRVQGSHRVEINLDMLALGMVLSALSRKRPNNGASKSPCRDRELTFILKDSLGGKQSSDR